MIKVVSFDIGGTLVHTQNDGSVLNQIIALSNENALTVKELYKEHFLKKSIDLETFCNMAKISSSDKVLELIGNYYNAKKKPRVYDDVYLALETIKKFDCKMITLSNKSYLNPFLLKDYGLDQYFFEEIYSYQIGFMKPDIEIFQYAEQKLGVQSSEIIHIGDSFISDFKGAKQAGWHRILIHRKNYNLLQSLESDYLQQIFYDLDTVVQYIEKPFLKETYDK